MKRILIIEDDIDLQEGLVFSLQSEGYQSMWEQKPGEKLLIEKYNGVAVKTGEDDFSLKVNIYGYDNEMLEELKDYLLEGTINPEQMRKENSVIFKTIVDGQGYYNGIRIKLGDSVWIKTIKGKDVPREALRFLGESDWYQETERKVTALTSRPLAKADGSAKPISYTKNAVFLWNCFGAFRNQCSSYYE